MKPMVSGMNVPAPTPARNCAVEEGGEIGRQGREQAGDEQERHAVQKDSPDAENGAEIGAGDADQHLADAEARGHPGAFVEPEMQPAAQVREPESRDAAANGRKERADQDAQDADIGPERIRAEPRGIHPAAWVATPAEVIGAGADRRRRRRAGQGRRSWVRRRVARRRSAALHGPAPVSTVASTDMPGLTSAPSEGLLSSTIFTGHALDHLGEVAGRVVGRQQREGAAGPRRPSCRRGR